MTVGGPENWKDKIAGGLHGTVPVLRAANWVGRGDWIWNTFAGWQSIVVPQRNPQERIKFPVEHLRVTSPTVNVDASQDDRTTACWGQ